MTSQTVALPWEVRDPSSAAPNCREWTQIQGVHNPRAAVKEFLRRLAYEARNHRSGLVLEVRHPTSAPEVYEVRVTVPRPAFMVHLQTRKGSDEQ